MKVLDAYPWITERLSFIREEQGGAQVVCDCPLRNHDQSRLRLALGDDGRLLFQCFACGEGLKKEMLKAMGAKWSDCFPNGTTIERVRQTLSVSYRYTDAAGDHLFTKERWEPGRGGRDKEFRQWRPGTGGKRVYDLDGVRRVLYRLPDLLRRREDTVYVVGGEKDVDELYGHGLCATTNPMGESEEWADDYSAALFGRRVVVIADADAAGRRHANDVFGRVARVAAQATVLELPQKDSTAFLLALWGERKRSLSFDLSESETRADVAREFSEVCERGVTVQRV